MRRFLSLLLIPLLSCPVWADEASESERYLKRSAAAEQWFFHELPRHLANDVKESFWNRWHLVGLVAGSGAVLGLHQFDADIQRQFHPAEPLGDAKDVFNIMGNIFVLGGGALTATAIGKFADLPKLTLTGGTMLESLFLTNIVVYALKFSTRRERPDGSNRQSFPSGHAADAFALATVTEVLYGPLYGVPAYAVAGMIALSRLDSNKHWASDVAAGALIGTLFGLGTARFHKEEKPDLFVMPAVLESGIALNIGGSF